MDTFLKESSYEQGKSDSCLYVKRMGEELIMIALYVDNMLIASNSKEMLLNEKLVIGDDIKMNQMHTKASRSCAHNSMMIQTIKRNKIFQLQ